MNFVKVLISAAFSAALLTTGLAATAQEVPPTGVSKRIDTIKKRGTLRVGVQATTPWLIEDTGNAAEPWSGPSWLLAKKVAALLDVKLDLVPVSNETKVPVLAADQVDITITALAKTPARAQVIDFVVFSAASYCIFGSASNPKLKPTLKLDELNDQKFSIAYNTGGSEQAWLKSRFPKASIKGVSSSGLTAPVEEITSGRADLAPIHRTGWIDVKRKVPGLIVFPSENDCQDSRENAIDVGFGIDKKQPEFHAWLNSVAAGMSQELRAEELRIVTTQ